MSSTVKAQVMDLVLIASTVPDLPERHISRDDHVTRVDELFKNGATVVLLDGLECVGKTTFLTEYVHRYPHTTISLFLDQGIRPLGFFAVTS